MDQTTQPPRIPTGHELYDALMGHIEPELTTEQSPLLDERYKNETLPERVSRLQRYELAFERYETAEKEYLATLQTQVSRYKKETAKRVEVEERAREDNLLGSIVQSFASA